ncbi:hypothetical protein DOTSEDRAFT_69990 [Dothistroma septosporum NZE10]|uniref:Uncharacterized protein n=1 Tax=Dothistroma septosporum (strain NZE10 / CBS 128990) TaxID=675120 RepID=N1PXG5_DOTSN|nr:hypothetical protein DOTSEDRAFT_69990 [Dothistroma septosporum NZE10]
MDKVKGLAKGGWHPKGDVAIKKDTWKSDLKGMATGKKKDPYEESRNHQSAPLSSLRDPDAFGPPPKTRNTGVGGAVSGTGTASSASTGPSGGLGGPAVESGYAQRKRMEEEEVRQQAELEAERAAQARREEGYRRDTTGLSTANLPKPPVRRDAPGIGTASPALPPRVPPRQNQAPAPSLPPRQNEYPDENTPAPPPPYTEALKQTQASKLQTLPPRNLPQRDATSINQGAATRLGQAGVSVPGFGISSGGDGVNISSPRRAYDREQASGQLNELQQRFAKLNASTDERGNPITPALSAGLKTAAGKKAPPPPPPKKSSFAPGVNVGQAGASSFSESQAPTAPPLPLGSKPKPS